MLVCFDTWWRAAYTDALQEIHDSCAHINGFGSLKACELAKSPGRTKIMKLELTGVMKTGTAVTVADL